MAQQQPTTLSSNKVLMLFPAAKLPLCSYLMPQQIFVMIVQVHMEIWQGGIAHVKSPPMHIFISEKIRIWKKVFFEVVVMLEMYTPRGVDFET